MALEKNGMPIIENPDVIHGSLATLFFKHEGKNFPIGQGKTLEAIMGKDKSALPRLGTTLKFHRSAGAEITGELTLYYGNPIFRQIASEYINKGKEIFIDIVVTNDDPTSFLGQQAGLLTNVSFDEIVLAKFDINSDEPLEEDAPFTADGFEILQSFTHPTIDYTLVL